MSEQIHFTLMNGRFTAHEAIPILTAMADAKRQHHARTISRSDSTAEDVKAAETRIKRIESDLRGVLVMLREAASRGSQVDIEGTFVIKEIADKARVALAPADEAGEESGRH